MTIKDLIHKKNPDTVTQEPAAEPTASDQSDALSEHDIETENLKNAIAQVMAEETVVLPHIEQLSSSVAKESGITEEDTETPADEKKAKRKKRERTLPEVPDEQAKVSSWFVTFMAMRIPIAGWIYLLYLAFSKKTVNRRNFARAYLLIKLIFLVLGLIILLILISAAMNVLQDLLDYMAML